MSDDENKLVKLVVDHEAPALYVNPDIVAMLEDVLAGAKEGRITALAIATVSSNAETGSGFVSGNDWAKLIGAAQYVVHRICIFGDGI